MTRVLRPLFAALALGLFAAPALADHHEGHSLEDQYEDADKSDIPFANLPTAAQTTLRTWASGGQIKKVEQISLKGGQVHYKAEIEKADGQKLEVAVTADGKLVAKGEDID
ncbi:hypothetical protein [Polyangium spumosum]|uniref:PepSY domain-containing protein n=1 Tax=Polyangium spumosum TaxID=889282 RepID=A0A6N7PQ90_9BACT|nr:hypothetical protein [Polyangium spumosum]MRG93787.1 hypothetical protein [Polyangium spumosum]